MLLRLCLDVITLATRIKSLVVDASEQSCCCCRSRRRYHCRDCNRIEVLRYSASKRVAGASAAYGWQIDCSLYCRRKHQLQRHRMLHTTPVTWRMHSLWTGCESSSSSSFVRRRKVSRAHSTGGRWSMEAVESRLAPQSCLSSGFRTSETYTVSGRRSSFSRVGRYLSSQLEFSLQVKAHVS